MTELEKPCKDKSWRVKRKDGYYYINKTYRGVRYQKLHRYLYAKHYELVLSPKQEVRHLCHNTSCFEITHLALGSHAENMNDTREAQRGRGPTSFSEKDIRDIRELYEDGLVCREIGEWYGVHEETIRYIVKRKTFKWVQ